MSKERDLEVIDAVRMTVLPSLRAGVTIANGDVLGWTEDNVCVGGTRLALDLLKRYNIFGRALKLHVQIYNRRAWDWQQEHPDVSLLDIFTAVQIGFNTGNLSEAEWVAQRDALGLHERAKMRYCGHGTDERSSQYDPADNADGLLNGHVLAVVDLDDGTHVLLDPTATQFNTPQFGIILPPLAFTLDESGEEWLRNPSESTLVLEPEELNGGAILYRQPKDLAGVFDADDWMLPRIGNRYGMLLDALRGEVEKKLALVRL